MQIFSFDGFDLLDLFLVQLFAFCFVLGFLWFIGFDLVLFWFSLPVELVKFNNLLGISFSCVYPAHWKRCTNAEVK